ncbi:MAG TPA: ATP-binding protein [Polyangiaceae bacterium]|nr:ATP-binding protein [Polyangiaceae bacterium]
MTFVAFLAPALAASAAALSARALTRTRAELRETSRRYEELARRARALEASRDRYRALVESTQAVPWEMGPDLRFTYVGPQGETLLGFPREAWLEPGFLAERLVPEDARRVLDELARVVETGEPTIVESRLLTRDRRVLCVRHTVNAAGPSDPRRRRLLALAADVTDQKRLETELQQAQRLESVGRLAAGVAHEINTPVQFVSDSIHFVRDAWNDLDALIGRYRALRAAVDRGEARAELAAELVRLEEEVDLDYLVTNVPKAIERSMEGLGRVAAIVRSMKEFAHPDQTAMTRADLNHCITTTLTIARNEYKYVADVETELGELPKVLCRVGEINQVILNMIVNAAHAIGDVVAGTTQKGRISIKTRQEGPNALITIEDTGAGIPDGIRDRIFEPFFTTKPVGKGTGQGLAIARSVVVEKHGGSLSLQSEPGHGTTFLIRLPIDGPSKERARAA